MKIRILILLTFSLSGLGIAQGANLLQATADDEKAILIDMEEKLKDASSARLKDVFFIPQSEKGSYVMCGKVNAKNSYGAYAGYESFTGMRFDRSDGKHLYVVFRIGGVSAKFCDDEVKGFSTR